MHYPQSTPTEFSNAESFVTRHGAAVWCELCDNFPATYWLDVKQIAPRLPSLMKYAQPERYLRAVLKAVLADYRENPDLYFFPPVEVKGKTMRQVRI